LILRTLISGLFRVAGAPCCKLSRVELGRCNGSSTHAFRSCRVLTLDRKTVAFNTMV
jgi:hypothetical protein